MSKPAKYASCPKCPTRPRVLPSGVLEVHTNPFHEGFNKSPAPCKGSWKPPAGKKRGEQ